MRCASCGTLVSQTRIERAADGDAIALGAATLCFRSLQ
jgi:hypothetical protein